MCELANRSAERYCEQLVATVRVEHVKDATELRGYLDTAQQSCDFAKLIQSDGSIAPRTSSRKEQIDIDEVLKP